MTQRTHISDPVIKQLTNVKQMLTSQEHSQPIIDEIDKAIDLIHKREEYCEYVTNSESDAQKNIVDVTFSHPWSQLHADGKTTRDLVPRMLSGNLEGEFLKSLTSMSSARRVLEIGMYTGYSALAFAEALPPDGEVVTCDTEPYLEDLVRGLFEKSPHGKKIKMCIGDTVQTLRKLAAEQQKFDIIFLDADKKFYTQYLQMILETGLLAENGTICMDNALSAGEVYCMGEEEMRPSGRVTKHFNEMIRSREDLHAVLVPIRDGVLLIRRRSEVERNQVADKAKSGTENVAFGSALMYMLQGLSDSNRGSWFDTATGFELLVHVVG